MLFGKSTSDTARKGEALFYTVYMRMLVTEGHKVLLQGRNTEKLAQVARELGENNTEQYVADLSQMSEVKK